MSFLGDLSVGDKLYYRQKYSRKIIVHTVESIGKQRITDELGQQYMISTGLLVGSGVSFRDQQFACPFSDEARKEKEQVEMEEEISEILADMGSFPYSVLKELHGAVVGVVRRYIQ
ncbi:MULTISPECIES: hypothetical protein [Shewanella]|uniref:hypothetical protein n=1 Tax=Shewanella TaxID=22 RepID=UPI001AAE2EBF|nr:hypothetical protein [Shewanella algae]MBO2580255.1 hypothetical protein [Shewanella algae]HDS1207841.1 hypothetical protein [Shewanella algae]